MDDPISAVTAEQPDRVYAGLAAGAALAWSGPRHMWVAVRPEVVREVLDDPSCLVRPSDARVPPSLVDTRAGEIFGRLVRMTDGDDQARTKRAIVTALDSLDPAIVRAAARGAAAMALADRRDDRFPYVVSAYALGRLFGVSDEDLPELASLAGDFARCLNPIAGDHDVAAGVRAAERLWPVISGIVAGAEAGPLTMALNRSFEREGLAGDTLVANMIGFLFQAHDAVAGLIGNTVVHLSRTGDVWSGSLRDIVTEVAHSDPAIQNTRRFVARDTVIAGRPVRAGDAILAVLAGVGQGAGACPFGHGRHACPGAGIALMIAIEAVDALVRSGTAVAPAGSVTYRPSTNARIPELGYTPPRELSKR